MVPCSFQQIAETGRQRQQALLANAGKERSRLHGRALPRSGRMAHDHEPPEPRAGGADDSSVDSPNPKDVR